jgi:hypothetical protein
LKDIGNKKEYWHFLYQAEIAERSTFELGRRVMNAEQSIRTIPVRIGGLNDWPHWAPYAAVVWSLVYAVLGLYWVVSGNGFPYATGPEDGGSLAITGQFGASAAWIIVIAAGIPAAALGYAMLRGVKMLGPLFIMAGALISLILLLFMGDLNMLIMLAYIPFTIFRFITGADASRYVQQLSAGGWLLIHQLFCLAGGFVWLAATVSYARRSGDACLYCGRSDNPQGWTSSVKAARWGRIAVYVAMIVPVFYAVTRYAWALGIPLGMTKKYWQQGQARGEWTSGLFLATVGMVGALLTLGLIQRWGEIFPSWIPRLGGQRVPIALAVAPASIMSVLFIVTGLNVWSGYLQLARGAAETGQDLWIIVGPVFVFPIWGAALAVATLGYYFRRRRPCNVCGRGTPVISDD